MRAANENSSVGLGPSAGSRSWGAARRSSRCSTPSGAARCARSPARYMPAWICCLPRSRIPLTCTGRRWSAERRGRSARASVHKRQKPVGIASPFLASTIFSNFSGRIRWRARFSPLRTEDFSGSIRELLSTCLYEPSWSKDRTDEGGGARLRSARRPGLLHGTGSLWVPGTEELLAFRPWLEAALRLLSHSFQICTYKGRTGVLIVFRRSSF